MENELQSKEIEWPFIVEYFTKRGRPLSKEEINRLAEEDKKVRDDEEMKKRSEEEAERRRVARLMEDLEKDQDFDNFDAPPAAKETEGAGKGVQFEGEDADDDEEEDGYVSDPELGTAQRTVNFRDNSDKKQRALSAKGPRGMGDRNYSEKNLRGAKLTSSDYIDNELAKSGKKGKYGVTVPKPFTFDQRDKTKKKTIREQKIDEMIA